MARALAARARAPAPPAPEPLDLAACAAALAGAGADVARGRVAANRAPWTATGLVARRGAPVTWLAHGDSWLLSRRGPHLGAGLQLRARTGGRAPALSATGPTHTASAPHDGPIELACLFPDELRGPEERLIGDAIPRAAFRGGFGVVVAAWPPGTDVPARLAAAARADPTGLIAREAARLAHPVRPPAGWEAHPHVPLAGLHTAHHDGIAVATRGGVEIVRTPVRAPLSDTLELRWRWRVDALPSTVAEDTLLTHDYLSIAVELDDGRDLTYHWSAALPPETHYRCPLPHWRHREWHLVVRSGADGLGEWQREARRVAPDRDRAIGGPRPREVVAVWLIATTVGQRREGRAVYADVELVDGDVAVAVR